MSAKPGTFETSRSRLPSTMAVEVWPTFVQPWRERSLNLSAISTFSRSYELTLSLIPSFGQMVQISPPSSFISRHSRTTLISKIASKLGVISHNERTSCDALRNIGRVRPRNDVETRCDAARKGARRRTIRRSSRRDAEAQRKKEHCSMFPLRRLSSPSLLLLCPSLLLCAFASLREISFLCRLRVAPSYNYGDSLLNALNTPAGCHGTFMFGVQEPRGVGTSPGEPCRPTGSWARRPLRRKIPVGKCFDEHSCSRLIEAAIRTAHATFGRYVPTKLLEEVVYGDDDGKAIAEHAAAKCPEKDARGHIGNMIGWFSRRYTDSEKHNPNNLRGQPYFCAYRDRFERVKDSRTKTWSCKPTE
jgi:hypothetical protein